LSELNNEHKKRGRPPKKQDSNANEEQHNSSSYEVNSYSAIMSNIFDSSFFNQYNINDVTNYVKSPMFYNEEIRKLSWFAYNSSGIVTNTIDYMIAMPTLDKVIIKKGKNKTKSNKNKEKMLLALDLIRHKEFIRDCLFSSAIEGMVIYYCETAEIPKNKIPKTMSDYEVTSITEINEVDELCSLDMNVSMVSLPLSHCQIVRVKNSSYVVAFNLNYFTNGEGETEEKKLLKYPKEIRDGFNNWKTNSSSNAWLVLDSTRTIVHKIRSKKNEKYGRPLVLAALNNILYSDYFTETKRNILNSLNNRIYYQTFPEGKEKGTSALTKKQQEDQHAAVKGAILSKSNTNGTSFFSVAAGTKIEDIKVDTTIFDEKNEGGLNDNIATDLGFGASLLNASSSGNYSSQQNNLELICAEVFTWIESITCELNKVLNAHVLKDEINKVEVYYLPTTHVNRDSFFGYMKDLYMSCKGSLQAVIASTGFDVQAYMALMNEELDEDWENKYPVHATSFTMSGKDTEGTDKDQSAGRPASNSKNEKTMATKTSGGNQQPKSSTK
jgi:hypothetical protein